MSTTLSTDFQDDILASSNTKRKYSMTYNTDGTVSFEDKTVYSQTGSAYGAKEINEEREAINQLSDFKVVEYSGSVSLNSSNYYGNLTFDLSSMISSGYYPISVLRCSTGTSGALLYQFGFENASGDIGSGNQNTRFVMRFRNPTSSSQSGTGSAAILFAKTNYTK